MDWKAECRSPTHSPSLNLPWNSPHLFAKICSSVHVWQCLFWSSIAKKLFNYLMQYFSNSDNVVAVWGMLHLFHSYCLSLSIHRFLSISLTLSAINLLLLYLQSCMSMGGEGLESGRQKSSQLQVVANVCLQNLPLRSEVSPTHPQI